jgi:hypothetical protein
LPDLADLRWKEVVEGVAVDDELAVEAEAVRTGADDTGMTTVAVAAAAEPEAVT